MSNHAIGHDLSNVLEGIMKLYDDKAIIKPAVFKIHDMLLEILYSEDGNEGEMYEDFERTRCGVCLRKYESKEKFFRISYDSKYGGNYDNWNVPKISSSFCKQCLDKLREVQDLPDTFEEDLKKDMEANYYSEEDCTAY